MRTIADSLCWYDPRNPVYLTPDPAIEDPREPRAPDCACDCCFYGRDRLAVALIDLIDAGNGLLDAIHDHLTHAAQADLNYGNATDAMGAAVERAGPTGVAK